MVTSAGHEADKLVPGARGPGISESQALASCVFGPGYLERIQHLADQSCRSDRQHPCARRAFLPRTYGACPRALKALEAMPICNN